MNVRVVSRVSPSRPRLATLAVAVTGAAAFVAWFLADVAGLSEQAVVISVMVIAFVGSWIVTNARSVDHRRHHHHRVTMIPIRTRAG